MWPFRHASPEKLLGDPIFVVGSPRSGTTLVGNLLGAHPRVEYWNEPPAIMEYSPKVFTGEVSLDEARAFYVEAYGQWLRERRRRVDRFAEKCPRHALVLPFLAAAFPGATFVHVVRDGRAVVSSLLKTGWLDGRSDGRRARYYVDESRREWFETTSDAARAAFVWETFVRGARAGRTLAPGRYAEIRYEDLLGDASATSARLFDVLGLSVSRSVRRYLQRIRPQRDRAWRRELTPENLETVERTAGELLRELGYDSETKSSRR